MRDDEELCDDKESSYSIKSARDDASALLDCANRTLPGNGNELVVSSTNTGASESPNEPKFILFAGI